MCKPYTYYLYHIPTGKHYYGVQFGQSADPSNLWNTYFTSSTRVHKLIEDYGKESFIASVRKTFQIPEQAIKWERKFLNRIDAKNRSEWINCHNSDGQYVNKGGYKLTEEQCKARSGKTPWNKGGTHSESARAKISAGAKGRIPWNKGVPRPNKLRELQSSLMTGKNNPMFGKSAVKGGKWYTNGTESKFLFETDSVPAGFYRGRTIRRS